jgi:hypothetical protein
VKRHEQIVQVVAEFFALTTERLLERGRNRAKVWPRQVAITLVHEGTHLSCDEIAALFNLKDHGSVSYARQAANNLCDVHHELRSELNFLRSKLQISPRKPARTYADRLLNFLESYPPSQNCDFRKMAEEAQERGFYPSLSITECAELLRTITNKTK